MLREMDALQQSLFDTARDIDDFTHMVPEWEFCVESLLKYLEFYAMANDPYHPHQYLALLKRIKRSIDRRLELEE